MGSYDDFNYNNVPEDNSENNHYSEGEEGINDVSAVLEDDSQDTNDIDQHEELTGRDRNRSRRSMHQSLPSANSRNELDGPHWNQLNSHICPILGAMVVTEQAEVQMMKEYFEIEASKSTPQYGFRKGLKLFGTWYGGDRCFEYCFGGWIGVKHAFWNWNDFIILHVGCHNIPLWLVYSGVD